jgi:hypothetical protein
MSYCHFVAISGNTEEELRMNKRLQSQAKVVRGGQTVVFDINVGKIKGSRCVKGHPMKERNNSHSSATTCSSCSKNRLEITWYM